MTTTTNPRPARAFRTAQGWTPARAFLLAAGGFLLAIGIVGFAVGPGLPTTRADVHAGHGDVFGVFATNGWHNLAALGLALPALLVAVARPAWSTVMALAVGMSNAVVFSAFAIWGPATFLIAANDADQVMHAVLAVGGIAAAWADRAAGATRRARREA